MATEIAYLGLGSNMGDTLENIHQAEYGLMQSPSIHIIKSSSYYHTRPWGKTDQADFVNSVLQIETSLSPRELLSLCLLIEKQMGRIREEKWGPRIIDIDILCYGSQIINEPDLIIPHPYLHERAFVLIPFKEISPEFVHPVLKKSMIQLTELLDSDQVQQVKLS
jgi:2-amino-4-hydroxy-6-hydroxymethyldihydropteridine diphosphokinase